MIVEARGQQGLLKGQRSGMITRQDERMNRKK